MGNDENVFTFDTSPFEAGLKKVSSGIGGLTKNVGNMAKNVSKGMINAATKIGLLTLAFKGVRSVIDGMPEIGKTFKIAKDIMMKNLLFPLRKAIFPLLQKFLDWVRDNRAMFVKWGHTLVNIFHSIGGLISGFIDIGKKLASAFQNLVSRTFGVQVKSIQDLLNVLSFKMAVVLQFLGSIIEPLIDAIMPLLGPLADSFNKIAGWIGDIVMALMQMDKSGNNIFSVFKSISEFFGDIVHFVTEIVDSFVNKLMPYITQLATPLKDIVDAFKNIFDSIFGSNEAMSEWKDIFAFLGDTVGKVLVVAFQSIAKAIEIISVGIKVFVDSIKWLIDNIGKIDVLKNIGDIGGNIGKGILKTGGDVLSFLNPFDDVIITKRGEVVPVSPDDNIAAFKDNSPLLNGGGGKTVSVSLDFTGMQIVVQEGTVEEARTFGENIVSILRGQLTREMERAGIK